LQAASVGSIVPDDTFALNFGVSFLVNFTRTDTTLLVKQTLKLSTQQVRCFETKEVCFCEFSLVAHTFAPCVSFSTYSAEFDPRI
jgi:hypothetical protein